MLKHIVITYEAVDGKKFKDEEEAYAYENALIYKKSGFRFYGKDGKMIKDVSRCYDESDYFTIDHSKKEWNERFCQMALYYFGWALPDDVLINTDARRYRYDDDEEYWISVSRRRFIK